MPLISYVCDCGDSTKKFYRDPKQAVAHPCSKCGREMKRQLSAPSAKSITVIDNGFQAKRTEVDLEIVKSIEERSTKDFKKD
jgi:hypothetical protein